MVKRCINPECRNEFRRLRSGELYALENGSLDTRFVWLCGECASRFAVNMDAAGSVCVGERSGVARTTSEDYRTRLRLVCSGQSHISWHRHGLLPWSVALPDDALSIPTAA